MKKVIRLTENDLHKIVENSVKKILKEEVDMGQYYSAQDKKDMARERAAKHEKNKDYRLQISRLRRSLDDAKDENEEESIRKEIVALKKKCGYC